MNPEVKEYIQKGVDSLTRTQAEKDLMKSLAEDVKDKFEMSTSEFNSRCKAAYDLIKVMDARDKLNAAIEDVESLGFN